MKIFNKIKKKIAAVALGAFLTAAPLPAFAAAIDPWAAIAGALTATLAYKSCLAEILELGSNAYNQELTLRHDEKAQGVTKSKDDRKIVDEIMKELIEKGEYALDVRSLPFRWQVNANREFNACCYPTNYISVNSGLMSGLDRQRDEIASVLAHEMTHGIEQHSAYNYAKAVAQYYGITFLGMATNVMSPEAINILADYSIAKNVSVPTEYAADEGGFYLAASAGFNPGGAAASMSRLAFCTEHPEDFISVFDPYDHPDTDKREAKLAKMMTDYSCGHVTVNNRKEVLIDGVMLLEATWTDPEYDNSAENAYLIAGGLAKAFHDYDDVAEWNFRRAENGRITFLEGSPVFEKLREAVEKNHVEQILYDMVEKAYRLEKFSGARSAMRRAEENRRIEWAQKRQKALDAEAKRIKEHYVNSDIYVDLGLTDHAHYEIDRFHKSRNRNEEAAVQSVYGRALAYEGKFDEAIEACNLAITMDAKDPFNYLNRADVYRVKGDRENAIADCKKAIEVKPDTPVAHKMLADLCDELGQKEEAQKNYDEYKKLEPKAQDVPEEYLSAEEREKKRKEKEEAEAKEKREKEEKEREEQREKEKREQKEKKRKEKQEKKEQKEKKKNEEREKRIEPENVKLSKTEEVQKENDGKDEVKPLPPDKIAFGNF